MRTVTFTSVLNGVLSRMGLDPSIAPATNTLTAFSDYISSSVRTCWEMYPWPEMTVVEARQFYPDWSSANSYAPGDVVLGSDKVYYYCLVANSNSNPTANATNWQTASSYYSGTGSGILYAIGLDQPGETAIGEVLGVYTADPRVNRYTPSIPWTLTSDGVTVAMFAAVTSIPSTIYVQFTKRPSTYSSADYVAPGGTDTRLATVPYILAEAVKHGALAMALREDGQFEKATVMDQLGQGYLQVEWDKIEMKQGQQGRFGALSR